MRVEIAFFEFPRGVAVDLVRGLIILFLYLLISKLIFYRNWNWWQHILLAFIMSSVLGGLSVHQTLLQSMAYCVAATLMIVLAFETPIGGDIWCKLARVGGMLSIGLLVGIVLKYTELLI